MEAITAEGTPSLWGPPDTPTSFILQAFACPVPWSPHYISPVIRSNFVSAGFDLRAPPADSLKDGSFGSYWADFKELLANCTLSAGDSQYTSILSLGGSGKFERPNLLELLACIMLIAVRTP